MPTEALFSTMVPILTKRQAEELYGCTLKPGDIPANAGTGTKQWSVIYRQSTLRKALIPSEKSSE